LSRLRRRKNSYLVMILEKEVEQAEEEKELSAGDGSVEKEVEQVEEEEWLSAGDGPEEEVEQAEEEEE
jgi:hypothetical protein